MLFKWDDMTADQMDVFHGTVHIYTHTHTMCYINVFIIIQITMAHHNSKLLSGETSLRYPWLAFLDITRDAFSVLLIYCTVCMNKLVCTWYVVWSVYVCSHGEIQYIHVMLEIIHLL